MATTLAVFLAGVLAGQAYDYTQEEWRARIAQEARRDQARFERIQRKHGAVAVATDWSHALRLNGEVVRLRWTRGGL